MIIIALMISFYLIGSMPFSVWLCQLCGMKDPRHYGSKNAGTTNVYRQHGPLAACVLFLDAFKGWLPIHFLISYTPELSIWLPFFAAALLIGHSCSIFLRGKGGKGVATSLGCMLAYTTNFTLILCIIWIVSLAVTQFRVFLASIITAISGVLMSLYFLSQHDISTQTEVHLVLILCAFVAWVHRGDINRL